MLSVASAMPNTWKANNKYLLEKKQAISESWQSNGGVKDIGRFWVKQKSKETNKADKVGTGNSVHSKVVSAAT